MPLVFHHVSAPPLRDFDAAAPEGAVIGIIGETGAGKGRLLRLAAGMEQPAAGTVEAPRPARLLCPADALDLAPAPLLLVEHTFARQDAFVREQAAFALDRLRRARSTVLLVSHEDELQRRFADEIWWLHEGRLAGRGNPGEMLTAYRRHVAARARAVERARRRRWPRAFGGATGAPKSWPSKRSVKTAAPPWCGGAASWRW